MGNIVHLLFVMYFFLQRHENKYLGHKDTHEHGKRVDGGIGYRGLVVAANAVGVGQSRWVGGGSTDQSRYGEVAAMAYSGYNAYDDARHKGDDEAVENPPQATVENGFHKALSGPKSYRCHEEADAHLSH